MGWRVKAEERTYNVTYSANPPSMVTPLLLKSSHSKDLPRRQKKHLSHCVRSTCQLCIRISPGWDGDGELGRRTHTAPVIRNAQIADLELVSWDGGAETDDGSDDFVAWNELSTR